MYIKTNCDFSFTLLKKQTRRYRKCKGVKLLIVATEIHSCNIILTPTVGEIHT